MNVFLESREFDASRIYRSPNDIRAHDSVVTYPAYLAQKTLNAVFGVCLCIHLIPKSPLLATITWKSPLNLLGIACGAGMVLNLFLNEPPILGFFYRWEETYSRPPLRETRQHR